MSTAGLFDLYNSKNERINNNVWPEICRVIAGRSRAVRVFCDALFDSADCERLSDREFFFRFMKDDVV